MAKSSADDEELRKACEAAIEGTKQKIVMSIRVARAKGSGANLASYIAKWPSLEFSLSLPAKLYKLKHLSKGEFITNDPSGCTFTLGFDNLRSQSVAPPQSTMRNIDDSNRLIFCVLNICKDVLGRLPKVVGIDVVEMALWAKENTPTVTKQRNLQDGPVATTVAESDLKVSVERELLSQADEEDMEALLDNYAFFFFFSFSFPARLTFSNARFYYVMCIGEAEAFSERLKRELHALEAANVHAILESEPLIEEVLQGLEAATNCVDDMDEWLGIFNMKLRHMREDIESSVNNNYSLKSLISSLNGCMYLLNMPNWSSFDEAQMLQNVEACEWLTGALHGLQVPNLDPNYANMRAEDFYAVVDWAYKIDPVRCISMHGITKRYLSGQKADAARFVRLLLADLESRISMQFGRFVDEACHQIERNECNVRQMGVLSYIPRKSRSDVCSFSKLPSYAFQISNVSIMFVTLEKIAQRDLKYADIFLLENYAAFQNSLYDLANVVPTLAKFYHQASEAYEQACTRHISMIIYYQFERLFQFARKIDDLMYTITPEEIPFQLGLSKMDLRKMLKASLSGLSVVCPRESGN
ncbi:hypothetical protein GH714_014686 [Hevea brasiliensis]|uniref:Exocyst complex component Sec3 coiled-coil domain-containing protein n=1 Tax=Hevea brasiliensis TaxID=3981 RepID=A0A6A6NH49_HEVBR|nr:hypothetical protein GH714_014686 [Hevea brasiliensis]